MDEKLCVLRFHDFFQVVIDHLLPENYQKIWAQLAQHLDVLSIRTGWGEATYNYRWSDPDYAEQQIRRLK